MRRILHPMSYGVVALFLAVSVLMVILAMVGWPKVGVGYLTAGGISLCAAVGAAVVTQRVAQHRKTPQAPIYCKDDVAGGVVNNELRCDVVNANMWKCFLPSASCKAFTANVEKLPNIPAQATLKEADETGTVVVCHNGVFRIDTCRGTMYRPCDEFNGDGHPAWNELPWPVVRAAIGGILAGR